jgi:hypothetical protein
MPTEPKVKRCKCCQQVKASSEFYRNFAGRGGPSATCKKCVDTREEHRKQIEEENAGTTRAGPRAFVRTEHYAPPRDAYCRNDGLKEVPSRGFT